METVGELKNNKNETIVQIYKSFALTRQCSFRIHHHIDFELCYVSSGKGIYNSGNNYEINDGDIFVFKPNKAHCITDISNENMHLINLHINPQYFRFMHPISGTDDNFGIRFLSNNFKSAKLSDYISKKSKEKIITNIDNLIFEFNEKKTNYIFKIETLLNDIIIELSRYQIKHIDRTFASTKCSDDIFRTVDYINAHFNENLNLNHLATMANLTRTYYSHVFKSIMGLSVWEYISIKRIDAAIYRIRNSDDNILNIALTCGFNNTANFNRIFKKYTNVLPKTFKQ